MEVPAADWRSTQRQALLDDARHDAGAYRQDGVVEDETRIVDRHVAAMACSRRS